MRDKDGRKIPKALVKQVHQKDKPISKVVSLTAFDQEENLRVVIETPRDSRNKYDFDVETGMFECHSSLPLGMVFPFDFGFIPHTKAGDGDPLDVLVLMDEPAYPGMVVRARLIGVLEADQTEKDGSSERNDRMIAVHINSLEFAKVKKWKQLSKRMRKQIENFFKDYNKIKGKRFKVLQWNDAEAGYGVIQKLLVA